jgi:large subunit ribosomal protein L10
MKRMNRKKKEEFVEMLTEEIKTSKINILANFSGLSVPEMQNLREEVKKADGNIKVVKNNLVEKALKNLSKDELCKFLDGPMLLLGTKEQNEIGVTKSLVTFIKKKGKITLKAGLLNGEIIDSDYINRIGELPGEKEIQGKVVFYLRLPVVRLVNSVRFPMVKIINVINHIKEKKETENG